MKRIVSAVRWNFQAQILGAVLGSLFGILLICFYLKPPEDPFKRIINTRIFENIDHAVPNGSHEKYELIEFTDYQCPACRSAEQTISVLNQARDFPDLIIAQYPLGTGDSDVVAAASVMAASEIGLGLRLHSAIMHAKTGDLDDIIQSLSKEDIRFASIPRLVREGNYVELAKKCHYNCEAAGIMGTPTFCVRTPKGNLLQFNNVYAAWRFIVSAKRKPSMLWDP